MEIKEMMGEVDAHVQRLRDTFSFLLKYRELFRGTGLEFAQLKEYVPGEDDASRIDWKASLRGDDIYVKQYEEERDLDVIVLLDTCSSMLFGTQEKRKHEYAGIVAASIINAGIMVGDNVALGIYGDEMKKFLRPSNEESQYHRSLEIIVNDENYGGTCDLNNSLRYVLNNISSDSYLFVISDFIGLEGDWQNSLKMVSEKLNDVIGVMVRDLRDEELPEGSGRFRLKDPYSGNTIVMNLDKGKEEFERRAKKQSEKVKKGFRRSDCGFVKVFTHDPFVKYIVKEMKLRSR